MTILSVSNMELNNWFLFVMNVRIKIARDFGAKMNHDFDNGKSNGCVGLVVVKFKNRGSYSTLGSVDGFRALVPTPLGDHVAVGVGHHPVPGPTLVVHLAVLVAAGCAVQRGTLIEANTINFIIIMNDSRFLNGKQRPTSMA